MGGSGDRFPATRQSAIVAIRSADRACRSRAYDALVRAYWKPVYKYIRLKWRAKNEDAKDLTQGFFARAIEKEFFTRYDPSKAAFRTFLRTCLDGYVANCRKAENRLKRGGGAQVLSLDFEEAEGEFKRELPHTDLAPEKYFYEEWVRSLFTLSVDSLARECNRLGKEVHFELFRRYDLEEPPSPKRPTYAQLAGEFEIAVTDVTNYLAWVRRRFRSLVLERLRELTADEKEYRGEAQALLGIER